MGQDAVEYARDGGAILGGSVVGRSSVRRWVRFGAVIGLMVGAEVLAGPEEVAARRQQAQQELAERVAEKQSEDLTTWYKGLMALIGIGVAGYAVRERLRRGQATPHHRDPHGWWEDGVSHRPGHEDDPRHD